MNPPYPSLLAGLVFLAGASFGGDTAPPVPCWSADQLLSRPDERQIRSAPHPAGVPDFTGEPLPPLATSLRGSLRSVKPAPGDRPIALTFDLCERSHEISGYDGAIVDYLRTEGVRATFFAGGKWMHDHPERTQQLMADPLFELGNHGWEHTNLRVHNGAAARQEVLATQAEYARQRSELLAHPCAAGLSERLPSQPALFRFPYGACSAESLRLVNDLGLVAVQWNLVTGDPSPAQGAEAISRAILSQAKPGAIVIAHANGRGHHTAEALPKAIPELKRRGYRFVTVSELLASGEPEPAESCYEERPGDNLRYDKPHSPSSKAETSP